MSLIYFFSGNKEKKPRGAGVTGHDNPNFQSDETDGRNTDNAEKGQL